MKNKGLDEYTIHLIILIVFTGVLIILEHFFTKSIEGFFLRIFTYTSFSFVLYLTLS